MKKLRISGWAVITAALMFTGGCCPPAAEVLSSESRIAETEPVLICEESTAETQELYNSGSENELTAETGLQETENMQQEKEDEDYVERKEPAEPEMQESQAEGPDRCDSEPEKQVNTEKQTESIPETAAAVNARETSAAKETEGEAKKEEETEIPQEGPDEEQRDTEKESEMNHTESPSEAAGTTESPAGEAVIVYEMLELVNKERQRQGLGSVSWNASLEEGCRIRAAELSVSFSHQRPDQSSGRTAYSADIMAENAGENGRSAESMLQDWLASAAHRKTILGSEVRTICCARYRSGRQYYWILVNTD